MSERCDSSTPTLKEQQWAPLRLQYYPPPRDISQYASRALPPLPTTAPPAPLSRFSSTHESKGQIQVSDTAGASNSHKSTALGSSAKKGEASATTIRRPQIVIPNYPQPQDHSHVVSPQPQRPDSKLISTWVNDDNVVSPLYTPGTESWKTHIVSPLSNNSARRPSSEVGPASADYESWFDDTSSDEEEEEARPGSSNRAQDKKKLTETVFQGALHTQLAKMGLRSDPGTPVSAGLDAGDLGEPGPDVGRLRQFDDLSGRRTVQPQQPAQSGNGQGQPEDIDESVGEIKISFAMPEITTFSSYRPGASQRPVPPPLNLEQQQLLLPPVHEGYVKTPFPPPRADSASSQRSAFKPDDPAVEQQQKQRSGPSSLNTPLRPPTRISPKPPPGFTEVFSQVESPGVVSPVVKNILSKARQGLGIGSEDSRKERRREEFKRQIRRQNEA